MRGAVAILYPTHYETFGIAAAEALAVGTPVVASNTSAIPEVLGDCGVVVEECATKEMATAIVEFCRNESLRQQLITRGWRRAERFTWQACADRLVLALTAAD